MSILIFVVILLSLILVHEFGHFIVAKFFGIRVDEFGIGFPPKIVGFKKGETEYTINWLPFGGFVRIFGEDGSALEASADASRSMARKPRYIQALVLLAGVVMNIIAAWLILSVGYMVGLPSEAGKQQFGETQNTHITIVDILPNSPAEKAGILSGEKIVAAVADDGTALPQAANADEFRAFMAQHPGKQVLLTLTRGTTERTLLATPVTGLSGVPEGKAALGVALADVGILRLPPHTAIIAGGILAYDLTASTAVGLWSFVSGLFHGTGSFSSVSGPVGIVGVVGEASQFGVTALLMLAAVISINLAIINLVPFPALDGGRLLLVGIEAIRRKPLPQKATLWLNAGGFAILIALMLAVTYHDIVKLFA